MSQVKSRPLSSTSSLREWFIDEPIHDDDIARLMGYTRRVRTLGFSFYCNPDHEDEVDVDTIHPSLFNYIVLRFKRAPLFPNITTLFLGDHPDQTPGIINPIALYLPYLFSSTLNCLYIDTPLAEGGVSSEDISPDILSFLFAYQHNSQGSQHSDQPRLKQLHCSIAGSGSSLTPLTPSFMNAILSLHYLEELDVAAGFSTYIHDIKLLGSLQHLKTLTICPNFTELASNANQPPSSSLRVRRVQHSSLEPPRDFPVLESLKLMLLSLPDADALNRLFQLFQDTPLSSLKKLKINILPIHPHMTKGIDLSSFSLLDHFSNLLSLSILAYGERMDKSDYHSILGLRRLTHFSLHGLSIIALDANAFFEMVQAWPNIEHLKLTAVDVSEDLDMAVLFKIVHDLPNITHLEIPLSLHHPCLPESYKANTYRHPLQKLLLTLPICYLKPASDDDDLLRANYPLRLPPCSNIRELRLLARHLDNMFPSLTEFDVELPKLDIRGKEALSLLKEFISELQENKSSQGAKGAKGWRLVEV